MTEILISLVIVVIVLGFLWWLVSTKAPAPWKSWLQIVVILCGVIWLLANIRTIVHAIQGL